MTRLRIALLGAAAVVIASAAPASAQMNMNMPGMKMPAPKSEAAAKKPPAKKAPAKAPTKKVTAKKPAPKTPKAASPEHDMSTMPGMDMPPTPPADGQDVGPMPGMDMPGGHDMSTMAAPAGTDLPAGNAAPPPVPRDHASDRVYGPGAMAMGRHHLRKFHGGQKLGQVLVNLADYQFRKGQDGFEWNGEAWYGGDIDRLWVKSEGEGVFGRSVERAEVQALYSHAIDPYFNLQGGLRYDFKPNPSRVYATLGIEGLAPSFFELEGALFLSNKGELMARAEGYYDQRITQRLILQPRAEINLSAQDSRAIGVGSGLSDAEIGLRLRYDIRREFAPYVGVQYSRAFGDTRRFMRDAGEDPAGWSLLTGIRAWF